MQANSATRSATRPAVLNPPFVKPRTLIFSLLVSILLLAPLSEPSRAAGLLIAEGGFGGMLEIEEHNVDVTINNGIVVTDVKQIFRNKENRQVEALYTFPVPKGASVSNFSMWIEGREMIGEVVEKEKAREIYNSYKEQGQDPGLLEQKDYKTFEMRVFPIAPGAQQEVRVTYYQELDFDQDTATYVYPLHTATRADVDSRARERFAMHLEVSSAVPVTDLQSPSHAADFLTVRHTDNHFQASLEALGGDLNRDVVLTLRAERPRTGLDLITSRRAGEDGYFQLTLTAGKELEGYTEGMDYVFILDVSGSMKEDGKLGVSRRSIGAFLGELAADDFFEVMSFNVAPEAAFRQLRSSDSRHLDQAWDFLGSRQAKGGTRLRPALDRAYGYKRAGRPLNVVVLSDGMTEQSGRVELLRLIGERPEATRVFCIGVGNEVNRPLLSQMAEEAGGLAAFISRGDDYERQARAFRRKLRRPAGTDLEIEIEGVDVYNLEPGKLPNLYHGSPIRLYGRYRSAGPAQIRVRVDVQGKTLEEWAQLDFPEVDGDNPEIERMWAWQRIRRLLREADRWGERRSVQGEIVRLGEAYSIVTEYTSFLVLENDAEYRRWRIERRNALRIQRDRQSQLRVREHLARLRQSAAGVPLVAKREEAAPARRPRHKRPALNPPPEPATSATSPHQPERRRSHDFGGGALDPLSATLASLLVGLAFLVYRSRLT